MKQCGPLSLVESFTVLLRQCLLCHKEPARRIQSPLLGAFCLLHAGSLWHKGAYNRIFPCMEANYPWMQRTGSLWHKRHWSSNNMKLSNESGPHCSCHVTPPSPGGHDSLGTGASELGLVRIRTLRQELGKGFDLNQDF